MFSFGGSPGVRGRRKEAPNFVQLDLEILWSFYASQKIEDVETSQ